MTKETDVNCKKYIVKEHIRALATSIFLHPHIWATSLGRNVDALEHTKMPIFWLKYCIKS